MRRASITLSALLLIALGVFGLTMNGMRDSAPSGGAPPREVVDTASQPTLQGPEHTPPADAPLPESAAPSARVSGLIHLRGQGTPAVVELVPAGEVAPLLLLHDLEEEAWLPFSAIQARRYGAVALDPVARVATDAGGRFLVPSVPLGIYGLWARDARGRSGHRQVTLRTAGAHEEFRIALGTGEGAVSGRVFRRPGEAYQGLLLLVAQNRERGLGRVRTDETGRFVVPGVPNGPFQLSVTTREGLTAVSPRHEAPTDEPLTWVIEPKAPQVLRGRVLDKSNDRPVEGALVQASTSSEGGTTRMRGVRTDAAGTFALSVGGVVQRLQVLAAAYGPVARSEVSCDEAVTIMLEPRPSVVGRVVAKGTGEPVGGVLVYGVGMHTGCPKGLTVSSPNGAFTLPDLRPGETMVFALGGGYVSEQLADVAWQAFNPFLHDVSPDLENLTIEVVRAPLLEGRVVDDEGRAVVGARLRPLLVSTQASRDRPLWAYNLSATVASRSDGAFGHDGLIPRGTYRFRVDAPGFPTTESSPCVVGAPGGVQHIEIRLSRKRWVPVHVAEEGTHHPVSGALVRVIRYDRYGTTDLARARTSESGDARIGPLPPGRLGVQVYAAEHVRREEPVPVPPEHVGANAQPFQVSLEKGVVVRGRVVPAEGHGTVGLVVEARWHHSKRRWGHRKTTVAADGTFEIHGLRRDTYEVVVFREEAKGYLHGGATVVAPASDVAVELEFVELEENQPPGFDDLHGNQKRMTVRVTTPDGVPLLSGRVKVHPGQLNPFFGVAQGQVLVAAPYEASEILIEFPGGQGWNPAFGSGLYGPFPVLDRGTVEVVLGNGEMLRGHVLDPDGRGLPGVRVSALPDSPLETSQPSWADYWYSRHELHTDAHGGFEFPGLRAGAWWVAAALPPDLVFVDPRRVEVPERDVVFRTRRGLEVAVHVLEPGDRPHAGARVRASRLEGPAVQPGCEARTDRTGVARLVGLDPTARYILSVDAASDAGVALEEARVVGWVPAKTTIRLQPPSK